ncbi:unnamed protein product, partial [marine sediment metagenome]
MNKVEELQNKISDIIYSNATCIDFADPNKVWKAIDKEIREYTQQVKQKLLEHTIPAQKFFHALPPIAKDEYYQFINDLKTNDNWQQKQKEPDINDPKFWEHVGQSDTWLNESKYQKALKNGNLIR